MSRFLDQLFVTLINGGIILGIFVVLLLNNKGVRKSRANLFLSILLIAFIFSIFHVRYAGHIMDHFSFQAFNVGDPTFLLIAPLLWFYTEELTGCRVKFTLRSALHFAPFLVLIFCSISLKTFSPTLPFIIFLNEHSRIPVVFFWIIMIIQFSCYYYFTQRKWAAYQQLMKQEVSNTEDINISWVRFFMGVFLIINVFFLLGLVAVIHMDHMTWIWKGAGILFSLSIFALGYKGILQREVFDTSNYTQSEEPLIVPIIKPDQQQIDKLISFMTEKKPYLDAELTLSSLAKELNLSRSQLSQLINAGIGENFYDFVNKYRVEEVKKLMTDPKMNNFNLLGIALEAGFKSKSTFNLIFKRFTGLTPSEYKRNSTL